MNKLTTMVLSGISCLALVVISTDCSAQSEGDEIDLDKQYGKPWAVITTDISPLENLVRVNDTMRLKKLPNDGQYHLRPDPLLLGRWGGEMNYFVRLQQSENDNRVYCGDVRVVRAGVRIEHKLALSEVRSVPVYDDDGEEQTMVTDVSLFFYGAHPGQDPEPDGCTFHDIHGGLAHVHRTD